MNAAVAQITGTGTGAEVTFTALKTAFAQLASGGVGEKLKEFGVNIDANTIAADGFIGTLEKIKKSGADTGAILKAFGTEAGPVLQPSSDCKRPLQTFLLIAQNLACCSKAHFRWLRSLLRCSPLR